MRKKILFLAASPRGSARLALDEECREITQKLLAAPHRDSLELITQWAVRPEDLLQYLNEHKPHVVHFSGHGTESEEIVMLDQERRPTPVSTSALQQLFGTLRDNIRVVVLNACYSHAQAEAIRDVIGCAIGMKSEIGDRRARIFSAAFYQAIGYGRSIQVAFESGKTALLMTQLPAEEMPELLVRPDVDPAEIFLVNPSDRDEPPAAPADGPSSSPPRRGEGTLLAPAPRMAVFAGFCLLLVLAAAAGNRIGGGVWAALSPIPCLAAAYATRDRWIPRLSRYVRVQVATLLALAASSLLYLVPSIPTDLAEIASASMLALALTLHLALLRREVTWVTANPATSAAHVPSAEFRVSLQRYCEALVFDLDRYDREVNWSDRELTPLEAEIETERTQRLRPRIARDLVEAIRRDRRSGVFVVLGDPGSGKSVSLRRLVRVLCAQALETGVVPVYVNLREYPANEEPTPESLLRFIRTVTSRQTGRDGRAFLDTWYEPFRRSGRLFFVIDSFDELPAILDCDEKSDTHRRISASFDRFFTQEVLTCRAVLASRPFRAPVDVMGTRLLVRPFTESQVRRAMQTWLQGKGIDVPAFVRSLFQSRPHLVPLLRNPFTAELIAEYAIRGHGTRLPQTMFEVFDQYLTERLEQDRGASGAPGPPAAEVRIAAGVIATEMYRTRTFGLEADVDEVTALLAPEYGAKAAEIIEALRYARLARVGGADRRRFSFVHRRFAEFFVVDSFRTVGGTIDLTAIPTDSRWRDCLVMCCGVFDLPQRQQVADYCWSVIEEAKGRFKAGRLAESRDAIHCIRFLADAFRSDPEALVHFRSALGELTLELLGQRDLLVAKIAAELIPLLDDDSQEPAVVSALMTRSRWISDTTLNSCRHLSTMSADTTDAIRKYFRTFTVPELLSRFPDLNFSLSLSEAFRPIRTGLKLAVAETIFRGVLAAVLLSFTLVVAPVVLLPIVAAAAVGWALHSSLIGDMDYRGVLGFRDGIDAWSRVPVFVLTPFVIASLGKYDWAAWGIARATSASLHEGIRTSIAVTAMVVGMLSCISWESIVQSVREFRDSLRELAPSARRNRAEKRRIARLEAEQWVARPNAFVKLWREPSLENLKSPVRIVGFPLLTLAVIVGLVALWSILPLRITDVIIGLLLSIVGGLLVFATGKVALRRALEWMRSVRERRAMMRRGFPEVISCPELYETLLSLRASSVRAELVRTLRFRKVKLAGELTKPPKDLLKSMSVAEELARLREQWLGLVN